MSASFDEALELFKSILKRTKDKRKPAATSSVSSTSSSSSSPLTSERIDDVDALLNKAVESNNIDDVRQLLDDGANPNVERVVRNKYDIMNLWKNNWSPLHMASDKGNVGIVKLLVEHGAAVNALTADGFVRFVHLIFYYSNFHVY